MRHLALAVAAALGWLTMGLELPGQEPAATSPQPEPEAETEVPELPETVVVGRPDAFPSEPLTEDFLLSPTRSAAPAGQTGSSVSVITREDIVRSGQSMVADVLRGTLGLDVVRSGGPGGITSIFLRGANSQQTKVLLDGIPLNDPSNATRGFDFSNLTVEEIERIEVVRGPQSVLYGSDAIGGVVNLITRRGEGPPTVRFRAEGGSFGSVRESLGVSGGNNLFYYSLGGAYSHTDGISAASERLGNTERDRYRNGTVSGRFGWTPSEILNVDYVFRYVDADAEIDSLLPPDFTFRDDLLRQNLTTQVFNRIQLQSFLLDGLVSQKVGFSLADYDRRDTAVVFPAFEPERFAGQNRQFDWQGSAILLPDNTLTAGLDYLHEEAGSNINPLRAQNNLGLYVQDQFRVGKRYFGTAGVRWDQHSAAGRANTYRITNRIQFEETGSAAHGTLGTGFRAPALAENFFTGGTGDLLPETSKGWDVGWEQQLFGGKLVLDATYYRNDFRNLIVFDFVTSTLRNIGLARATGIEVTGSCFLSSSTVLVANYTLDDTRDLEFGGKLPRRPQQKTSFTISRSLLDERARVNLYFWYVGDRLDLPERFGGGVLPEYILVNLTGNYQLTDRWDLFARIENLFDEQYEEAANFGAPGIAGYAGASLVW